MPSKGRLLSKVAVDSNGDVESSSLGNVPSYDDTSLVSSVNSVSSNVGEVRLDVGVLAFQAAQANNQSAFSLPNAFVDQFEDGTGIDTTADSQRDTGEFIATVLEVLQTDSNTIGLYLPDANDVSSNTVYSEMGDGSYLRKTNYNYSGNNLVAAGPFSGGYSMIAANIDDGGWYLNNSSSTNDWLNTQSGFTLEGWARTVGTPRTSSHQYIFDWYGNNRISYAVYNSSNTNTYLGGAWSPDVSNTYGINLFPVNTWKHWAFVADPGVGLSWYVDGTRYIFDSDPNEAGLIFRSDYVTGVLAFGQRHGSNTSGWNDFQWITDIRVSNTARYSGSSYTVPTERFSTQSLIVTSNPTGNFTGVTQTSSASVSEMSVVVMYEDNAGTAALNTDMVVEVSANNGADWSTVTLQSAANLSSTIKVAKSNSVAVTAGTQPKYRISFANQASGSKVTRIRGVSLLY